MDYCNSSAATGRPDSTPSPVPHGLARLPVTVAIWLERRRGRNILAGMDARMLKDIGLSRADALAEVRKPFWRG